MENTTKKFTGRVYCVRSPNTDKLYIGSTIQRLSVRMGGHRTKRNSCNSSIIIDAGNAYIELIELMENVTKEELRARELYYIRHDDYNKNVVNKLGNRVCPHGGEHNQCKDCGGSGICPHDKRRTRCKECGGETICEHNRERFRCKDCKGAGICEHNKLRYQCKDCGGSGICPHDKRQHNCKDCGGSSICKHNKRRHECKDCSGASICEHNKRRRYCVECSPWNCDICDVTVSKGNKNRHLKTKKHIKNST